MQANLELNVAKDNLKLLILLSLPLKYQDFRHAGQRYRRLQEPMNETQVPHMEDIAGQSPEESGREKQLLKNRTLELGIKFCG